MKTERQIRNVIRMLEEAGDEPCRCRGTSHEDACHVGGMLIMAQLIALRWAIGEVSNEEIMGPLVPPWKQN